MNVGVDLTAYDFVVLIVFIFFIGRGIWLGFLKQVTGLLALYLGYIAASQYNDRLFPFLRDISDNPKVVFLITYIVLFAATFLVVMLIGKGLKFVIEITITGWFDRLLGSIVGVAKALLCTVLLHMVLGTVMAPENEMLRNCATCPAVNSLTDFCRDVIKDPELRDSLKQQMPAISIDAVQEYLQPTVEQEAQVVPPEQIE